MTRQLTLKQRKQLRDKVNNILNKDYIVLKDYTGVDVWNIISKYIDKNTLDNIGQIALIPNT